MTGEAFAEAALGIRDETALSPKLASATRAFSVPLKNEAFRLMGMLGIITSDIRGDIGTLRVRTQVSLLTIGSLPIVLVPGELFPELAFGVGVPFRAANAETLDPPSFAELLGTDEFFVFGLADDEIGYIVPPSDFVLDGKTPYFAEGRDRYGREHYEETNSVGPLAATRLAEALGKLIS